MGNYDYLDGFNLASHGDHREQEWVSVIAEHFPVYEVFWRRYVVPLTNRVDPRVSFFLARSCAFEARTIDRIGRTLL